MLNVLSTTTMREQGTFYQDDVEACFVLSKRANVELYSANSLQ